MLATGRDDDITRRQLARGTAWAVPVVAMAAAAPAVAASGCPTIAARAAIAPNNTDRLTVTNTGDVPIPTGRIITFTIRSLRTTNGAFTLGIQSGVLVVGSPPTTLPPQTDVTMLFTTTAPVSPGGTVFWDYGLSSYNYDSRLTLNAAGGCAASSACASDHQDVFGTVCPGGGSPVAPRSLTGADAPGPRSRR